jgi:hypothetical protein
MIEEGFRTRPILDALFARYADALKSMILTNDDSTLLKHIHNFPVPFEEVTSKAEGHNATLDCFQLSMEFLISHFEDQQKLHSKHTTLLAPINKAWLLFSKYYGLIDESGAYITAALLHPERRYKWLRNQWNTPVKKKRLKDGLQRAQTLWQSYRDRLQPIDTTTTSLRTSAELSAFEKWQQRQAVLLDAVDSFTSFNVTDGEAQCAWKRDGTRNMIRSSQADCQLP